MDQLVNLKRFRQKYNLTQTAAAEGIGIDQRQWNRYENEKNDLPIRYLKAICEKYNVSADWLLGLTKDEDAETEDIEKFSKFADKPWKEWPEWAKELFPISDDEDDQKKIFEKWDKICFEQAKEERKCTQTYLTEREKKITKQVRISRDYPTFEEWKAQKENKTE